MTPDGGRERRFQFRPVSPERRQAEDWIVELKGNRATMDDATAEKIARNNSTFRDANNEIEAAAVDHSLDQDKPIPFICECSDARCTEIIRITLEEYMRVRSDPRWFAHAPGHDESIEGAVRLLERTPRFVLVEKIERAGAKAAELADHRPEG